MLLTPSLVESQSLVPPNLPALLFLIRTGWENAAYVYPEQKHNCLDPCLLSGTVSKVLGLFERGGRFCSSHGKQARADPVL